MGTEHTLGIIDLEPTVLAWALRVKPGRDWDDPAMQERSAKAIAHWLGRWAKREGYLLQGDAIIGANPAHGLLFVRFKAYGGAPEDWYDLIESHAAESVGAVLGHIVSQIRTVFSPESGGPQFIGQDDPEPVH